MNNAPKIPPTSNFCYFPIANGIPISMSNKAGKVKITPAAKDSPADAALNNIVF